ncbi:MAG: hypothetical protein Q8O53_01685 [Candidatus Moranbacteria bacterium]|nr:hypothetical protein [Candidatus Moranbacteria bacterium]
MRLSIGFPECFSTTKVEGPFPLSIIRELAEEAAMSHHGSSGGSDYPENNDVLSDLYVPYIRLLVLGNPNKNIYGQFDFGMPTFHLPFDEAKELKQGVRIEWKGTTMVVLENNPYNSCITMAPAACIALDL